MKKSLFMIALASVAMASCSNDEPSKPIVKSDAISFKTSVLSVRGTDIDNANLQSMTVAAFDKNDAVFFAETAFNKDGSGKFVSTPEYKWPGNGDKIKFYCYAPASATIGSGTMTFATGTKQLADFSPKTEIKDQVDFVTAFVEGSKADGNGVQVNLRHQLSQIKLKAKCDNAAYTCQIKGVKIGRPVAKGSFAFPEQVNVNGVWTPSAQETDKLNYKVEYVNAVTLTADAKDIMDVNGGAMMIPQTLTSWDTAGNPTNTTGGGKTYGAYVSVKMKVVSDAGKVLFDGWSAVPMPTNTKWEAGKIYTYTLDYSKGLGKVDPEEPKDPSNPDNPDPGEDVVGGNVSFEVTVEPWTAEDINIDVK
ncbi:MAG: fimbrillin family protein [Alistipes sp.]